MDRLYEVVDDYADDLVKESEDEKQKQKKKHEPER